MATEELDELNIDHLMWKISDPKQNEGFTVLMSPNLDSVVLVSASDGNPRSTAEWILSAINRQIETGVMMEAMMQARCDSRDEPYEDEEP